MNTDQGFGRLLKKEGHDELLIILVPWTVGRLSLVFYEQTRTVPCKIWVITFLVYFPLKCQHDIMVWFANKFVVW